MQQITIDLQPKIAKKFNNYVQLFGSKEILIDKFIEYHVNRIKREIARMQIELEKYEKKYNLKTLDFYNKFESGELGDESDFMVWSGIYELQIDSKKKLESLL